MSAKDMYFLPGWPPDLGPFFQVALLLIATVLAGEIARQWLRLPRILGYILVGAGLGPNAAGVVDASTVLAFRPVVDIAVGLLLFELGQRVDLGWLRRNPWLLATSVLESALAFMAVFALLVYTGARPAVAWVIALFAIATSPAVVMTVVKDLHGQGQVTERALLLTALNTTYAVLGGAFLVGWLHLQRATDVTTMFAHPAYIVVGSALLSAIASFGTLRLLRTFGRRPGFQFALIVAVILLAVAAARAFKLSVPLTLLIAGLFTRSFDRRRHFFPLRFGESAMLFVAILFAVAGASLQFSEWRSALVPALAFIVARFAGKAAALLLFARPSSLTLRDAMLVNIALVPMSGLSLLLLGDLTTLFPEIAGDVGATVLLAIAILTIIGPLATEFALRRAGDAAEGR